MHSRRRLIPMNETLIGIYAFTVCDFLSSFAGKGWISLLNLILHGERPEKCKSEVRKELRHEAETIQRAV